MDEVPAGDSKRRRSREAAGKWWRRPLQGVGAFLFVALVVY
jgi:hypothetical protein